jgi:DNA polymerase, archaea type
MKMNVKEFVKGSIVSGKSGELLKVDFVEDDVLLIPTETKIRRIKKSAILKVIQPDPRKAIEHQPGRVNVELDRLALSYQSAVPIPTWEPTANLQPYEDLSKLYIDIETTGLDPKVDRVLMVGLMSSDGQHHIITGKDEQALLAKTMGYLKANKPQCLIGHNHIAFDLPFLMSRCDRHKVKHPFRLAHKTARITASSFHGKPIEFTPVYWKGVDILDTFQQIAIWDKSASKLTSYGLKNSTIALGLRDDRRLELTVEEIRACWDSGDVDRLSEYLIFDLDDTRLLADFLLPVVWYQMAYVPNLTFQTMAVASPALKAQKVHQSLLPGVEPISDEKVSYQGANVGLLAPGLHSDVAKIDVSSLYPSIMLNYGICSKKDPEHRFLGWLKYLTRERLRLKELAKQGDKSANFKQNAMKILINGSYGFLGTGFYTFNDYEAAALVTAYGRMILNLMTKTVEDCGGLAIELDTDGILFSHEHPDMVATAVGLALPEGINIDLEMTNCGLYAPKAKNYVIVHPSGKLTIKGIFRKRNRCELERAFPVEYIRLYFTESPTAADEHYQQVRESIANGSIALDKLTITRKIASNEKGLVELGLGQPGETVSYWFTEKERRHKRTGKLLWFAPIATNTAPYWPDFYLDMVDRQRAEILGITHLSRLGKPKGDDDQMILSMVI